MIKKGRTAAACLVVASLFAAPAWSHQQGGPKGGLQPRTIDMNAVVCKRLVLIEVQGDTKACNWHPLPIDAAVVHAIHETDAFIIRNSSSSVTQQMLDQSKQGQIDKLHPECKFDPKNRSSGSAFIWAIRQQNPVRFAAGIRDMVSLPLGPGLTPCM